MTAPRPEPYKHPDDARMAALRRVYEHYLVVEDIYPALAHRFKEEEVSRFAELGAGRGPIAELLLAHDTQTWVVDSDPRMLSEAHGLLLWAELAALPLPDRCLDGASAVNCLYFLADPRVALREARRTLRPGGLFVASSPSRFNDPELQGVDPRWGTRSSFDAEDAPSLVAEVFGEVEVEQWRVAAYVLPDQAAIADYLHAFDVADWQAKAAALIPPITITKSGAHVWARA